jgi:hypothetical protein
MRSTMPHRNVARRAAVLVLAAMFALPSAAAAAEPFVPGVTDSSTGVLRSLERRGLEPGGGDADTDSAASGFGFDDAAVAVAAAGVIASLAVIVAGGRRRRIIAATAIGARR